jgi:hypothetical protein
VHGWFAAVPLHAVRDIPLLKSFRTTFAYTLFVSVLVGFVALKALITLQPRRDGSNMSEEFAWESREFLRKLTIGRVRPPLFTTPQRPFV